MNTIKALIAAFLAIVLGFATLPVFADAALLAALQEAGVVLTEEQAAAVENADEDDVADVVAGLVASLGDGASIDKVITAATRAFPAQAGAITSSAIAQAPSLASAIAGAAVAGSPSSAAAITSAAVTAAPTRAAAIVSAAKAAAPAQAAAIESAAEAAQQANDADDEESSDPPSPST